MRGLRKAVCLRRIAQGVLVSSDKAQRGSEKTTARTLQALPVPEMLDEDRRSGEITAMVGIITASGSERGARPRYTPAAAFATARGTDSAKESYDRRDHSKHRAGR